MSDADKTSYLDYYKLTIPLMRKNGVALFDNIIWFGKVWDVQVYYNGSNSFLLLVRTLC